MTSRSQDRGIARRWWRRRIACRPWRGRAAGWAALLITVGLLLAGGPAAAQQAVDAPLVDAVASEDLDDPEMALVPLGEPASVDPETAALFAEAETVFQSADQVAALPLLTQLVERLQPLAGIGHPEDEAKGLLTRALVMRAEAVFNLGEEAAPGAGGVDADLQAALRIDPGLDLDRDLTSAKLVDRFDDLRTRLLGFVTAAVVDPPDLVLRIDGRRVDPLAGPMAALAGSRQVVAQRIGYAPLVSELEVTAGDTVSVDLLLDRVAPVLRLHTRPSGATVAIDGIVRGTTRGVADPGFVPSGAAARFVRDEFSAAFELADLGLGQHRIEVTSPGYRAYRAPLQMFDPIDYEMPPIVLERERGTLLLSRLPEEATVRLDGEIVRPERRGSRWQLDVPPGDHRLLVEQGPSRMFARALQVADRQTVEVRIDLKPGLGLLGVIGGDDQARAVLERRLREQLGAGRFTAIEHHAESVLASLDLDTATLRTAAPAIDWRKVQREMSRAHAGMVYVLAVLSDDLLATHADLWVWAPPAAPPAPARIRIALDDRHGLDPLAAALNRSLTIRRAWLGAQLIDGAAGRPVVVDVTPRSPAAALIPGDRIVAVNGRPAGSAFEVTEQVRAAEIGEPVQVTVERAGGPLDFRIVLGSSPQIVATDDGWIAAAVFADLDLLEARVAGEDRWLVRLNRAKALLDAGEWVDAARELRAIEAPEGPGIGQGTVDYLLGVALRAAGSSYLESARAAFERAAAAPGARLVHHDGPWVAPRARARLHALAADAVP